MNCLNVLKIVTPFVLRIGGIKAAPDFLKILVALLFVSFASVGQIVRQPVQPEKIPFAGMLILVDKYHPFPRCEDFAKLNWDALKKRHNELKSRAVQSHEVTIIYPGNKKIYLTFDQLKEIACK